MSGKLGWGILGTGRIAGVFAKGVTASKTGRLVAVGSRSDEKARKFAAEFSVPKAHGSYEALLADPEIQAVYIATPHSRHAEWAVKAAEAGKHVLCEKPLAVSHAEAMQIVEAAGRYGVMLMEAFMYRCHPQTARLVALLREKAVGEVLFLHASFGFRAAFNPAARLFANALAGGGILDVGCYPVSMARLVAGAAIGRDFAEPISVKGSGVIGATGVDERAAAVLAFPGGIVATVETAVTVELENTVRIFGTEGRIEIPQPWIPARDGGAVKIRLTRKGVTEEIVIETPTPLYAIEADAFAEGLSRNAATPPAMTPDDSLGNMKALDLWREAIGLVYDAEKPANATRTVTGRPLSARPGTRMPYGNIPGIAKPVSRLVMGADNQKTIAHASAMFDDFFERGGTCYDTAWVYGSGTSETMLGWWIRNRGIREKMVILGKGAHTPFCDPANLTKQLLQSLERLQTGYIDLYMLHRDNPDVPVGEFCDVLNEHVRAGRIRAFGGSNWPLARVDAFNAFAAKKGLTGMAAVSNQFSLARMVAPPWAGCLAASDPGSRAWLARTKTPLFPWSSQARGFFLPGKARPDDLSDKELVTCWYARDNFARLARAEELARNKHVETIVIALAYVLAQPFPTFPLIGPRTIAETASSFAALDVPLTAAEVTWLDLGTGSEAMKNA
ncbi:MAG: aldo/keto reductase [Planctomycetota bacterium]